MVRMGALSRDDHTKRRNENIRIETYLMRLGENGQGETEEVKGRKSEGKGNRQKRTGDRGRV